MYKSRENVKYNEPLVSSAWTQQLLTQGRSHFISYHLLLIPLGYLEGNPRIVLFHPQISPSVLDGTICGCYQMHISLQSWFVWLRLCVQFGSVFILLLLPLPVSVFSLMFPRLTVIPRQKFEKELNLSLEAPSSSRDCQPFRSHLPPLGTQRFYIFYVFKNFDSQHILIP